MHHVDDGRIGLARDVLVTVITVRGLSAERGLDDDDGLPLVVQVGMGGKLRTFVKQRLEDDELVIGRERCGVERERHLDVAFGALGREFLLGRDGVAVNIGDDLARGLVHKRARNLIGLAGGNAFVMHLVGDGHVGLAHDFLIAVGGIGCRRGKLGLGDADGLLAVVDVGVRRKRHALVRKRLERDDLVALVERTRVERERDVHIA